MAPASLTARSRNSGGTPASAWAHLDVVYDLEMADGAVVTTTEDHPFYNLTDREWQRADKLDAGDTLLAADGSPVRVAGIDSREAEVAQAYNLTVEGLHTYYVLAGATPVLVHNEGPCTKWASHYERAGDLADRYIEGQSTRDPASQWYHEELSNEELLDEINNAAE